MASKMNQQRYSILFVEDNALIRNIFERNIQEQVKGTKVYAVSSQEEMLDKLKGGRFDLMVFDLGCGDAGYRTLHKVRDDWPSMVVLGVSGGFQTVKYYKQEAPPVDEILDGREFIFEAIKRHLEIK